ncbi:hypothetical protein ACN28I_40350 [Archangium gephyra]|uniref:hypothetical protein n=1 Tax=Archangium gephyra TaxID=48 RepID=UPI003B7C84C6
MKLFQGSLVGLLALLFPLWSHGSTASQVQARRLSDLNTEPLSSTPTAAAMVDGTLFFSSRSQRIVTWASGSGTSFEYLGPQLWKSDGTSPGTVLVQNQTEASLMFGLNGRLYFYLHDLGWRVSGGFGSPGFIGPPGRMPTESVAQRDVETMGGALYFPFTDGRTYPHRHLGAELYKIDTAESRGYLVKDILPGTGSSTPSGLETVGGTLFFAADDGDNAHGREALEERWDGGRHGPRQGHPSWRRGLGALDDDARGNDALLPGR